MFDTYQEHREFVYATDADWDREEARMLGAADPSAAWVCTGRDVWYANPFYTGPKVPHPEDDVEECKERKVLWAEWSGRYCLSPDFDEGFPW